MSTTYDEPQFVDYGEQVLHCQPDRSSPAYDSKSPATALNALPRVLASYLDRDGARPAFWKIIRSIRFARIPSLLATLLLNFFIYRWAYELYGPAAAIAACIMLVFSPSLIAHGVLATNDGYFATGVIVSLYLFRRFLLRPTLREAWISGLALGIAQLTKAFAIYLYAVVLVVLMALWKSKKNELSPASQRALIGFVPIALLCFLLAVNAGFCFDRSFTPLRSYSFDSAGLARLQKVPLLHSIPLPLPYPFLQGRHVEVP